MTCTREQHFENYKEILNYISEKYPEYKYGFEKIDITPWGEVIIQISLQGKCKK